VRPFSLGRKGILLGDGVAAIVLEAGSTATREPLGWVRGWGRAGDAYHVVQPRPDGSGLARAIESALHRAAISPAELGYVNAHGSGSPQSDVAEANALRLSQAHDVPVSSTKSLHGQSLEASPLVELIATVLAIREGQLPPTAGFLEPDPQCSLNLILDEPLAASPRYALSLNSAFGGANTALIVGAP
jgi:3-oxoacyl-(acyl-carrier-protein) synthase